MSNPAHGTNNGTQDWQQLHLEFLVAADQPFKMVESLDALIPQLSFFMEEIGELQLAASDLTDLLSQAKVLRTANQGLESLSYGTRRIPAGMTSQVWITFYGVEAIKQCLADVIDGFADTRYTGTGFFTQAGILEAAVMLGTHANNMSKFWMDEATGKRKVMKENGKVKKHPAYVPLDFTHFIPHNAPYLLNLTSSKDTE